MTARREPGPVLHERDAAAGLARALGDADRVLLVASARAARADWLAAALAGRTVVPYAGFGPNPRLAQVLPGCALRDRTAPAVVLGVGGGSAMDVAKAVRALPADRAAARAALTGPVPVPAAPGLVLVPTTAGSGSEVTGFATLYDRGRKLSLDRPGVAAEHVVADPAVTAGCPPEVRTAAAADALCHAVESYWSRRATDRSRRSARLALAALLPHLLRGLVPAPGLLADLSAASIWAGRAIAETRTTAAHAFAYPLTARYGVPHGIAALLHLQWVWPLNARRVPAQLDGLPGGPELPAAVLRATGWPTRLRDHGVPRSALPGLARAGAPTRVANNPTELVPGEVRAALAQTW